MSDLVQHLAHVMADLHPGFDVGGCAAKIHEGRHLAGSPAELAYAVVAYAMRADVKTPALFAADGSHWHTGRTPNARPPKSKCADHPDEYVPCRMCPVEKYGATDVDTLGPLSVEQIERNARGIALVRDALSEGAGR